MPYTKSTEAFRALADFMTDIRSLLFTRIIRTVFRRVTTVRRHQLDPEPISPRTLNSVILQVRNKTRGESRGGSRRMVVWRFVFFLCCFYRVRLRFPAIGRARSVRTITARDERLGASIDKKRRGGEARGWTSKNL